MHTDARQCNATRAGGGRQAGTKSYSLKFEYPVRLAYKMHDAIMQGRFGKGTSKELVFEFGPPK